MLGLSNLAKKVFGTQNDRLLKSKADLVTKIREKEETFASLSDVNLKAKTTEYKNIINNGNSIETLLDALQQ